MWALDGAQLHEYVAHTAYIYALRLLPNRGFVSAGEDKCVHVWSLDASAPQQTLRVAGSAWGLGVARNGDVAVAVSDSSARVFSRDAARRASPALTASYLADVDAAFAPKRRGVDAASLPTREVGLQRNGTHDGENRMVSHDGQAEAWSWSAAAAEWQLIGTVEGAAEQGAATRGSRRARSSLPAGADTGNTIDGVAYDWVFNIDIDTGTPLKVRRSSPAPFPHLSVCSWASTTVRTRGSWRKTLFGVIRRVCVLAPLTAQRRKHQLDQGSLQTIAEFITRK